MTRNTCLYKDLCLLDGRVRCQGRKIISARWSCFGVGAGRCESAARKRRARDRGAGLAGGGSAGRSARRATRARAVGRGRSPWPRGRGSEGRGDAGAESRARAPQRPPPPGIAGPASGSPLAALDGKEYLAPSTNARRCGRPPSECPQGVGRRDAATAGGKAERSRLAPVAPSGRATDF